MKQDFQKLSQQQLQENVNNFQQELSKLRMQRASGAKLENPGNVRKIRRNIARIFTVLTQHRQQSHTQKTTAEKQGGARKKT